MRFALALVCMKRFSEAFGGLDTLLKDRVLEGARSLLCFV